MSIHRYAAARDKNERRIVEALRAAGASVRLISAKGFPDAVVGIDGVNYLMEFKDTKGKLTDDEFEFFETWPGQVALIRTVEEALMLIGRIAK